MLGIIGIIVSLILLMTFAYRGVTVILLALILALLALIISGDVHTLLGVYTEIFMSKMESFIFDFFPLFLLGAIFGKMMDDSGAARTISSSLVKYLGHKQAMFSIVLACSILTYGGVSAFVVGFAIYPIAASLFREANIPKRLIPGAIALGALTFTMTAIPGSPAIQNTIPTIFFATDTFAAPGIGVIAGIIMLVGGMLWLNYRVKKFALSGEGYGEASHDLYENKVKLESIYDMNLFLALFPLIVVIITNVLMTKYIISWMDTEYLETKKYGFTNIESVGGIWSIIVSLFMACLVLGAICWKRWGNLKKTVNDGVFGSLLPIFNTASEVGYGGVIATLAGFTVLQHFLMGIAPDNPLISEAIIVASLAGITGSASGGLSIALETMSSTFIELAAAMGVSLDLMHRVSSIASGGLDCLPHNGAVITMFTICGLTHRQSYFDVFIVAVVIPVIALIVAIIFGTIFGVF